ncbi:MULTISPECIES: YkvA family protein [Nostocales]|uniref:DUF1232 domain-containing protein n=3 Tax=Nostocales TaxID=1161 RepID=A0A0C1QR91_9CYAN|nr:YkvA family protein [Tolypothrix bouteillei]KAF3888478.1 DUF1232 domain-containing protein [Tolypothrix bouteillei VB521301]
MQSLKKFAKKLKQEVYAVYLASKDPRTPWYAKVLAVIIVAYAFSPLDLIPDPIPLLGYLDDLIIIPLGIWLVLKLIPPSVLSECRERAEIEKLQGKPTNWIAAIFIVVIWLLLGIAIAIWLNNIFAFVK